ncbi:hypothetical protein RchiOBHm_Chr6g0293151 [Rosa chinensis]|uniref:Uncharacterized protein n=1 Tax=Rosa chinensis TaxID=74649 RepID=A0A2P6PWL6_ROSCH|nr:hypothetical protein RchiOBHm_Chr6g0293151 [Rosa chinensis]
MCKQVLQNYMISCWMLCYLVLCCFYALCSSIIWLALYLTMMQYLRILVTWTVMSRGSWRMDPWINSCFVCLVPVSELSVMQACCYVTYAQRFGNLHMFW